MASTATEPVTGAGPAAPWLASGFLLAGLGTVLLGPLLPFLSQAWNLTDSQSGLLLLAKFIGAFLGGATVPRRLRLALCSGTVLAFAGFTAFALSGSLLPGCVSLFVSGLGLGQIIASTNILAGRRYLAHTGSALASLNFFWSLGAVITGLLVAALLPRFGLRGPLLWFAALFLVTGLGDLAGARRAAAAAPPIRAAASRALPVPTIVFFAVLLFLYGGLETCLTAWITTFTVRFSDLRLLGGQSGVVLLWAALTAGRVLASVALRYWNERLVLGLGLLLSSVLIGVLGFSHRAGQLSVCCILIGLGLAPFFPAIFALLMQLKPSARVAGFILAVSGLGAALFPWLMGVLSTSTGSLRIAMSVPWTLAVVLLLLAAGQGPGTSVPAPISTSIQGETSVKKGV